MDKELHQVSRAFLNIETLVKLIHNTLEFCFGNFIDFALKDNLDNFFIQGSLLNVLSNKRVEWVSQLMGHSGVNHHKQIRMGLLLVILNFRRNILDLKHERTLFISFHFALFNLNVIILTNNFKGVVRNITFTELKEQIKDREFSFNALQSRRSLKGSFLVLLVKTNNLLVQNLR